MIFSKQVRIPQKNIPTITVTAIAIYALLHEMHMQVM